MINYSFPVPPTSDDALVEAVSKIHHNFNKRSLDAFNLQLEQIQQSVYESLDLSTWDDFVDAPGSELSNYPAIYSWLAMTWRRMIINEMPEQQKLFHFIKSYRPELSSNYLVVTDNIINAAGMSNNSIKTYSYVHNLVSDFQHLPSLCACVIATKYPDFFQYAEVVQKQILKVELPEFDYEVAKSSKLLKEEQKDDDSRSMDYLIDF